jgi:hypothetical protein
MSKMNQHHEEWTWPIPDVPMVNAREVYYVPHYYSVITLNIPLICTVHYKMMIRYC